MEKTTKPKATRRIKSLDFSGQDAAIALVGPVVGGPANGVPTLLIKSGNFSDEFLQKMQQVKVTLELPEFLERFFNLYGSQAEVLARMMGYEPKEEDETEYDDDWYENYIQSQVNSFEIIKSLKESESISEVISKLTEDEYLALLKDQQQLEKAFEAMQPAPKKATKKSTKVAPVVTKEDTSPASEVIKQGVSTSEQTQMEKSNMDEKEMIEKSALVELQKSFAETQELLKAAQAQVAQFQADKKEALEKARQLEVNTAVKDAAKAAVFLKALKDSSDEDFQAVVKALAEMQAVVEKSDLFIEKGATTQEETAVKESPVERLLKAKFQSK